MEELTDLGPTWDDQSHERDVSAENTWLTLQDAEWLGKVRGQPVDEVWLEEANSVIATGAGVLTSADSDNFQSTMRARTYFYGTMLGWEDENHDLHGAYQKLQQAQIRAVPLETAIDAQRALHTAGADLSKVVKNHPLVIARTADAVRLTIYSLQQAGVDAPRVIDRFPTIFGIAPDTLKMKLTDLVGLGIEIGTIDSHPSIIGLTPEHTRQKLDGLKELGLDELKVANHSAALVYSIESVKAKIDNLNGLGIDASKAVNTAPGILNSSPASIQAKLVVLQNLGIDAVKVVSREPRILSRSSDSIAAKVEFLDSLGIDAVKVINTAPGVIGYADESILAKIDNLSDLGINATRAVNRMPIILSFAPESVQAKLVNLQDLGINAVKTLNSNPGLLCIAPETMGAKVSYLTRIGGVLGWDEQRVHELIDYFPVILSLSRAKLATHARLFASYGSTELDMRQVKRLIVEPLESHLIAVDKGIAATDYSAVSVERAGRAFDAKKRKARALELVANPAFRRQVGQKTIRAYTKYAFRPTHSA
jgi:hypothetical protein